jgi:hypothetical protein
MLTNFQDPIIKSIWDYYRYFDTATLMLDPYMGKDKEERISKLDKIGTCDYYIIHNDTSNISKVFCFGYHLQQGQVVADATFLIIRNKENSYWERGFEILTKDLVEFRFEKIEGFCPKSRLNAPIQKMAMSLEVRKIIRICLFNELYSAFSLIYTSRIEDRIRLGNHQVVYFFRFDKNNNNIVVEFICKNYETKYVNTKELDERVRFWQLDCYEDNFKIIIPENKVNLPLLCQDFFKLLHVQFSLAIFESIPTGISMEEVETITTDNFLSFDLCRKLSCKSIREGNEVEFGKLYRLLDANSNKYSDFSMLRHSFAAIFSGIDIEKCEYTWHRAEDVERRYID